jgi:alpha-L-fucosidase 2
VRVGYDADEIIKQLKDRIKVQSFPNLWITQSGGGIETLSAVPMTINEMLLQSYEGVIRIFPNWDPLKDASFGNLRAYGAFLVSSSLKGGKIGNVTIFSEKGLPIVLQHPWKTGKVKVFLMSASAKIPVAFDQKNGILKFKTVAGKKYLVTSSF